MEYLDMLEKNAHINASAILLAGGKGSRFGGEIPKQYLKLKDKPIALFSFEALLFHPHISEVIVVCDPQYREMFITSHVKPVKFADPGERRQDSVLSGLNQVKDSAKFVCVHDSARPFIDHDLLFNVLEEGVKHGAATLSMPLKFTIKKADAEGIVQETPDRSLYHEIQTPQVLSIDVIRQGFKVAHDQKITVTDDVSLAELVKHPVKLVRGASFNLKITTQDDLYIAAQYLED